jgi:hypothetical protein
MCVYEDIYRNVYTHTPISPNTNISFNRASKRPQWGRDIHWGPEGGYAFTYKWRTS